MQNPTSLIMELRQNRMQTQWRQKAAGRKTALGHAGQKGTTPPLPPPTPPPSPSLPTPPTPHGTCSTATFQTFQKAAASSEGGLWSPIAAVPWQRRSAPGKQRCLWQQGGESLAVPGVVAASRAARWFLAPWAIEQVAPVNGKRHSWSPVARWFPTVMDQV